MIVTMLPSPIGASMPPDNRASASLISQITAGFRFSGTMSNRLASTSKMPTAAQPDADDGQAGPDTSSFGMFVLFLAMRENLVPRGDGHGAHVGRGPIRFRWRGNEVCYANFQH